ncbi:hypothetical protein [Streptomyces sp. CBMA29]|uniref:hypothetical protein n=1 Tax=Streptomyces sp. CBMA29 TaxID=1896314 RepID=UPI00166190FD|nr:hypothetical protein [Streptomyces sp. CBMA29]MBD0734107.1 hypothetical protein [Streptomyces sp. CBMA29]
MSFIRVLICQDCQSTEVLPDYAGDPAGDEALIYATGKHVYPNGEKHFGRLYGKIEEEKWKNREVRDEVLRRIWQQEGHTGFEPWVYNTFETLKADAMQCWTSRLRPETCSDYRSESKRLLPPTAEARKAEGMGKYKASSRHTQYLCSYCPINSVVEQKERDRRGLYK